MLLYGKYRSLTLINWNGFFARTFELDVLVTTLSGGNGAGKSTTMAAFVTALIPDLSLLHFRNTTEAGATLGSRDKGLYGKLRPGVCYAILDIENGKDERILCGVRLQQVAGRDKKVDIKPFIIQNVTAEMTPIELVTKHINERQVRIVTLAELRVNCDNHPDLQCKLFNVISDYHSLMFDLGILPKRLRGTADRSKYYRLLEASLYGGISSTITRALRDYLLPENTGVRKAFQDMESALRENRMTLDAIQMTQSDRNLFKHLITAATDYVGADYMRHLNERRLQCESALAIRTEYWQHQKATLVQQQNQYQLQHALNDAILVQKELEVAAQIANEQLNMVQTLQRQQEKIDSFQIDIEELETQVTLDAERLIEVEEQYQRQQLEMEEAENEVDEIKSQLANYQQALNSQQTRAVQYEQAMQALQKARSLCNLPKLSLTNADSIHNKLTVAAEQLTVQLCNLEQSINLQRLSKSHFDNAFSLLKQICPEVPADKASEVAQSVLAEYREACHHAQSVADITARTTELKQRLILKQQIQAQLYNLTGVEGSDFHYEDLVQLNESYALQLDELSQSQNGAKEQKLALTQEMRTLENKLIQLKTKAPDWLKAQDALLYLQKLSGTALTSTTAVLDYMQAQLGAERQLSAQKAALQQRSTDLDQQIKQLSQPNGALDSRLIELAERVNGVLLSEIYDDIAFEDAPYFSALYGPARQAIIVSDLEALKKELDDLESCPEDLYFIEGDPNAFDDSVFEYEEKKNAILVKSGDRQWRYSSFPAVPIFGRAARERQLEQLTNERAEVKEQYLECSLELQKITRQQQHFSQFVSSHVPLAFDPDPEYKITLLKLRQTDIAQQLSNLDANLSGYSHKIEQQQQCLNQIQHIETHFPLLIQSHLEQEWTEMEHLRQKCNNRAAYVNRYSKIIDRLEPMITALHWGKGNNEQLLERYEGLKQQQSILTTQIFAIDEIRARRIHFSYGDAATMVVEKDDLKQKLHNRLHQVEQLRRQAREQFRHYQNQYQQSSERLVAVKSAYETKQEILQNLIAEQTQLERQIAQKSVQNAEMTCADITQKTALNRHKCTDFEKKLLLCENEIDSLRRKVNRAQRDYRQLRQQIVTQKVQWCTVCRLVKENNIEHQLHRRDFAYLSANELRSLSDKALGSLRQAVANNEHLRDSLRDSEDSRYLKGKIRFYLDVYCHLRERIRQDILHTDDPIAAIEQMEIELARLTDELNSREQKLAISAKSVANIIRKTILREQNRIAILNQALRSIIFGQVKGVRLDVSMRPSHANLLSILAEQHEQHQDLFSNNQITFSEALAKLYQRLNPQLDLGQRPAQIIGEELLDYRNYLVLDVEVNRGTEGWLHAESGALSTGEAIGTGMAILLMVMQSWEEESKRLRRKDLLPCRLLFLDEAARLDTKSIATLFELCERLQMQLIIAAPENISPEKGTTYKLVRKVIRNQEHVQVVGLRGFVSGG